jgi:hypothetical protein
MDSLAVADCRFCSEIPRILLYLLRYFYIKLFGSEKSYGHIGNGIYFQKHFSIFDFMYTLLWCMGHISSLYLMIQKMSFMIGVSIYFYSQSFHYFDESDQYICLKNENM